MSLTARELAMGGLFGALALALSALFHLVALAGPIFLPMYLPVVALAFVGSARVAALVGFLVPLVSGALTGMPPFAPPIAPLMSGELLVLAGVAGAVYHRFRIPAIVAILIGNLLSRAFLAMEVVVFGSLLRFHPPITPFILGSFVTGLPGLILQLVAIPALLRAVQPDMRKGIPHEDS